MQGKRVFFGNHWQPLKPTTNRATQNLCLNRSGVSCASVERGQVCCVNCHDFPLAVFCVAVQLFSLGFHAFMPFVYTVQGQYVTVLLAALHEVGRTSTKMQTIAFIEKMGWLDLEAGDWQSYPTHKYEAIWHTKIAFARQWALGNGLIADNQERDEWAISNLGRERLLGVREKFRAGIYNIGEGHVWSLGFKRWLRPGYEPSAAEDYEYV
jgi:hypothetical protein